MPIIGNLIKRGLTFRARLGFTNAAPEIYQREALRTLLLKAQDTAFGREYRFAELLYEQDIVAAFQNSVPTHDYQQIFDRWWHRTLGQEPNVCWNGTVKYFALSSGTAGAASKYIPVTEDMTKSMQRAARKMFFSLTNYDIPTKVLTKGMMMVGGSADLNEGNGYFYGDLSGINANRVPIWMRRYYKPGTQIARIPDWDARIATIAKNAADWDIGFMTGIPAWVQLMMERVIEYHKVETIHDVWPNLSVYVSGGVAFEPYRRGFEQLLARPLVYMDSYLASEGFISFQGRPQEGGAMAMQLVLNNGIFFEFVPFNDRNFDSEGNLLPNVETLTISEVEKDKDYALLLSTCAGAWRYLIGDTVRFTDTERCEIVITGRTKHFLSICGEHLSVDNMNRAIQLVSNELGITVREFTVSAMAHKEGFFAHKWYIGSDATFNTALFTERLDEHLKALNDDYRTERQSVLKDLFVEAVSPKLFYEFQAVDSKRDGQAKFPRVMKAERFKRWETFVQSHKG